MPRAKKQTGAATPPAAGVAPPPPVPGGVGGPPPMPPGGFNPGADLSLRLPLKASLVARLRVPASLLWVRCNTLCLVPT